MLNNDIADESYSMQGVIFKHIKMEKLSVTDLEALQS